MVAIGFAVLARAMGSVTDGGALVGVLVAFVLMSAAGFAGFVPLAVVFLLTVLSTRWGYARKQTTGRCRAQPWPNAAQVCANLGAATLCAAR